MYQFSPQHSLDMSTPSTPAYSMMQESEDDLRRWSDLATDSETEEAQKTVFFDNLKWKPVNNIVDDSSFDTPIEIGNSDCKPFTIFQNRRSPEPGSRRMEAKGCPDDLRNHFRNSSERTHVIENFLPAYGNTSCSYDVREAEPKFQSSPCYDRGVYSTSPAPQHGTDSSNMGESVYLSVRRRQPLGKSLMRSSVQGISRDEDLRRENMNVGWERCTDFDGEGSSENKDAGSEKPVAGATRIKKEGGNDQGADEYSLKQWSNTKNSPRGVGLSPLSGMETRDVTGGLAIGGSLSGSERDPKKMTTQPKRRILINTSNSLPLPDVHSEKESYPHGSPERSWIPIAQPRNGKQDHQSSSTYTNVLPRSTSSRNLLAADGSATYRSLSRPPTLVDARKLFDARSNEERQRQNPVRSSKDTGSELDKFPSGRSEQGSQRSLQLSSEYEQSTTTFDSRDPRYMRLNKISEGAHPDIDGRAAQHSMPSDLADPPSPAIRLELERKVEELEKQIADERKRFQLYAERLAEQQVEADKNVQHMQDDWDGKIRELQKEKYALSIRLQSTETAHLASLLAGQVSTRGSVQAQEVQSAVQPAANVMEPANGVAFERHVSSHRHHEDFLKESEVEQARPIPRRLKAPQHTDEEAALKLKQEMLRQEALKLRQEMLQQEVLIRGYQHENEKAMEKIKELQAEAKEKTRFMSEENAKLASQLMHYQHHNLNPSGTLAATELSLQEALDREAHLQKLEVQLKKEIARLKDELLQAHAELERTEKRAAKTLNDLEYEIERLKSTLAEERENHARTCFARDDMMNTLSENQKLLSSQESTIEHNEAHILELGDKIAYYEGQGEHLSKIVEETPIQDKRSASVNERSLRRIQPPLKQGRKPEFVHKFTKNGLINLAQAPKDESDIVRKLQAEISALKKKKRDDDENSKMLKHELEIAKREYEKRLMHLQVSHPDKEPTCANEQITQNRVKALETQVVKIRIHYARKLKEMSEKLAESKNEQIKLKLAADNAAQLKKNPSTRMIKVKELQDGKERISILEDMLQHKELSIKNLQTKLGQLQTGGKGDDPSGASSITAKQVASLSKIKSKIQSNSPQRRRPIHPDGKFHDSEEPPLSSPKVSSVFFDDHGAGDHGAGDHGLREQTQKQSKQVDIIMSSSILRNDAPLESEPDIVSLRKRLERNEVLQQQSYEAMQKATRCSIQHLQQDAKTSTEHQSIPTRLHPLGVSGDSGNTKSASSGAMEWRNYNDPLERENRALQARSLRA